MRATCTLLLRQLSLLLLLLQPAAGSGPRAASSDPPPRTQLSGATTPAAAGSSSRAAAAAAAAAASLLPPWERESSVPWAPPVSSSTSEPAAGGHTSSPVIGSRHQTLTSLDIEMRTSNFPVDNMDTLTTFSRSGERTLLSITNSAMPTTAPESTISYTEIISSADLTQHSSSVEQSGRISSSSDRVFTEPGMESLIVRSSEIPTYSSSQSDAPVIGSSHQTASNWDMEKKIPSSHDDHMYISPTFSREIAVSSDVTHSSSSMSWTEGSNLSSASPDLLESSTGPLLIHSSLKSDFSAIEGSQQPMSSSDSENNIASSYTATTHISATSTRAGEGKMQSLVNSSRSSYATGSSASGTEMSSSSYFTSSVSSIALTDPLLPQSNAASETTFQAIGNSHQPINSSEKRTSDLYTTSIYISTSFTKGGERTLRSLMNSKSPDMADSSTANLENITSSDLPQPSSPVVQTGPGGNNISSSDLIEPSTEPLLTHSSKIPSYSSSPHAIESSHRPINISATEKMTSDVHSTLTYISTTFTRGGERTLRSLTHSNVPPPGAESSTSNIENTKPSDLTQASISTAEAGGSNFSSRDFTEPSTEPLLTRSSKIPSYSSSPHATESSHRPINISATEKMTSDVHSTLTYISTTFTRGGERTLRSLTHSNVLSPGAESSTSDLENTKPSDLTQTSVSAAEAGGSNISSRDFTEPSTEPFLTRSSKIPSYSSSPNGPAATGSSHQPMSISATENSTSDLHISSTYISTTFTRAAERTLTSLINSSIYPAAAESATSYLGNTKSSDLPQPLSPGAEAGENNISSTDFTEPSTEPLLTHSSKIHSYSSSPNGPAAIGSSHQPISISVTETRTSDLHTSSTYIPTISVRGEKRTARSVTYNSMLPDVAYSSTSYLENTESSDVPQPLSPVTHAGGNNISASDFTEPSTEPLTHSSKTPSDSSSPNDLLVMESSHQPISISATENRTSDLHTSSTYISTTFTGGGERTLTSLINSSTSPAAAESATSYLGNTKSSDLPQPSTPVAEAGENNISSSDFTEPWKVVMESSHQPISISVTETRTSDLHTNSTYIATTFPRGETTLRSLTNSMSPDAAESSTSNLENTESSVLPQRSSSVAQTGGGIISSSDFIEPSTESLLTHSSEIPTHSSSSSDLAGVGSSHRSVIISDREKGISSSPTHRTYVSTAFTRGGEKTSESQTHSSTSTVAAEIFTTTRDAAKSSDSTQFLSSVSQTGGFSISSSDADFMEPSTEPLLTESSEISTFSLPNDMSTIGSNHQSLSSSNTEKRISSPYTDSTYHSATSTGSDERPSQSLTNSTSTHATESSASYTEIANSSALIQSSSMAQTRGTNISAKDVGFTGSSTETFFRRSSKIPTYSSFQNDPSSFASSYQPVSSIETEKRTSASRTDSTYISTTFSRGGDRTLLSISNNSTSAESSESSTFYADISSSSELAQSSSFMTQSRGSNISSSEGDLIAPSTEPLLVQSSKMATYSSTVNLQNTTLSVTGTESSSTGRSSSSSVFPPSSSAASLQPLISSTPLPPQSFASSESSLPSSSSGIRPSSLPPPSLSSSSASSSVTSFPIVSSVLPSSSSSSRASDSFQTSVSTVTSEGSDRTEPTSAVFYGSTPGQYRNHSGPHQQKESTSFKTVEPLSLQTEPMEQFSHHSSSTSASLLVTESSTGRTFTSRTIGKEDHVEKTTLLPTTAATSLSQGTQHTEMAKGSTSILPNMTHQREVFPAVELTTGKTFTLSTGVTSGPAHALSTTDQSSTMHTRGVQIAATTTLAYVAAVTTKAMETSTTASIKITEENIPATHPPKTSSTHKTTARFSTTLAAATKPTTVALLSRTKELVTSSHTTVNICSTNPCLHDGKCIITGVVGKHLCKCSPAWQGEDCSEDVDECLSNPCPAFAICNNTQGSYVCKCPLGYQLEKRKCSLVKTFVGELLLKLNTTHGKYSELRVIEDEIITMLNMSLSTLPGYYNSEVKAIRESNSVRVSVQATFSLISNATFATIVSSVKSYIRACKTPAETCQFISSFMLLHRVDGLCKQKDPECDRETSECSDSDGIAVCQCKSGYFKYNKMDHSCRACEDGYKLENETCVRCPFGLGGFNCRNPYQLITVVIAAAGGGLLLILGIALIITCCRKNKNDISKLIFKSGDFQMSPYAEYPKNPRAQEWGREAIEMQENGSTKNLLQMTDVYYSPTCLRNSELERNGLYPPYTGLPGSRHSCIYPGQYNPSFISDETRRRDYF
ncbi:protein HEG homolog 1 isoform X2 [Pelodiscus sinensis]|uniref:protein HEG homolog 1 isoform X2 n=1 Tax=Pelodiscus sinensis TaxID=13735 RepID=UPI003F6CAFA6